MSLILGLTGGIGSGKSTVARIFGSLGAPFYEADKEAKRLMNEEGPLKLAIIEAFGPEAYTGEGTLNRTYLSKIVFQQPDKLAILNSLVHPATATDFSQWVTHHGSLPSPPPLLIKEAAILFESGAYTGVEAVLTVYAPKILRIRRVCARDQVTEGEVMARMKRQWTESEKIHRSDFVIFNDEQHSLALQVKAALNYFVGE
ncbi:MAG: dephospho-CoA kinase [Bacteroidota bacterium]